MGKEKVQAIENKKPSDTLGNRLSAKRAEIVCALEFYLMKRLDDKSRMKREFHVRFCESLRGKLPWATRLPKVMFISKVSALSEFIEHLPTASDLVVIEDLALRAKSSITPR